MWRGAPKVTCSMIHILSWEHFVARPFDCNKTVNISSNARINDNLFSIIVSKLRFESEEGAFTRGDYSRAALDA